MKKKPFYSAGRRGREINLIVGVEHRLRTFFGLVNYQANDLFLFTYYWAAVYALQ